MRFNARSIDIYRLILCSPPSRRVEALRFTSFTTMMLSLTVAGLVCLTGCNGHSQGSGSPKRTAARAPTASPAKSGHQCLPTRTEAAALIKQSEVTNKLDRGLTGIYVDFLSTIERHGSEGALVWARRTLNRRCGESRDNPCYPKERQRARLIQNCGRVSVQLHYTGDLDPLEARGFQTTRKKGTGRAWGTIELGQLGKLAVHPNVRKLVFGVRSRLDGPRTH